MSGVVNVGGGECWGGECRTIEKDPISNKIVKEGSCTLQPLTMYLDICSSVCAVWSKVTLHWNIPSAHRIPMEWKWN